MLPQKLAFVDIETTGARFSDRIIEIGILKVENNKLVQTYKTLLNPNCHIPEEITELTGITPSEVENAPTFGQVKKDILELLTDCYFVAHNVRFDYSFLKKEFKKEYITFKSPQLCTVKLSRTLFPNDRHHNLDRLIQRHGFKCKNRHRAFDDAEILWKFWKLIQKQFSPEVLFKAVSKILKKPSLPINLSSEILDSLPESPGVYIFYGENHCPLYVGKSINIRNRVMSHFSSDHISTKEMRISQQVKSIETIQTAGELGALFREANLVKKLQPLYNRQLRNSQAMTVLKKEQTKENYLTVKIVTAGDIDPGKLDQLYGSFRNVKSAKEYLVNLAKEYGLCQKILGVDNTNQACFSYRLGKCQGACLQKEIPARYNLRFLEAFIKNKFKAWPFESPIIIQEKNDIEETVENFLIDKWCYLGSVMPNVILGSEATPESYNQPNLTFDLDTYKILFSYINQPKNQKNIKLYR